VHDTAVRRPSVPARVRSVERGRILDRPDRVAAEEPLEIRVRGGRGRAAEPLVVTMRTPGSDFELAAGFCRTEGVVSSRDELVSVSYCLDGGDQLYNVVTVTCRAPVDLSGRRRSFVANASCGVCGKATLGQVETGCAPVAEGPDVAQELVLSLPERLREAQTVFSTTGGLHAAALFDATGALEAVREDVGRHNAVDKVVGRAFLAGRLPLDRHVLLVSGRVSFEIVQKAAVAGIGVVCAVSAPSSLAVAAAERWGQTLVGFLRGDRFNVYTHPRRLAGGR